MTEPCFSRRVLNRLLQSDPSATALRGAEVEMPCGHMLQILVSFALQLRKRGVGPNSVVMVDVEPGTWFLHVLLRVAIGLVGGKWLLNDGMLADFKPVTHLLSTNPAGARAHRNFILFEPNWIGISLEQARSAAPSFPGLKPDDFVCYSSSSATTGVRKLIKITLDEFEASIVRGKLPGKSYATLFSYDGDRVFRRVVAALADGRLIIDEPDPRIAGRRPDCLVASPVQISDWMKKIGPADGTFQRLPLFYSMGATITRELLNQWLAYFETVSASYAGAEMGLIASFEANAPITSDVASYTINPSVTVEIADASGKPLPAGMAGNIRVRSRRLDGIGMEKSHYREDGWFYPGDRGLIDENGRLMILGREGDVLNIGGVKFNAEHMAQEMVKSGVVPFAIAFEHRQAGEAQLALLADAGTRADHAALAAELRDWASKRGSLPKIARIHFSSSRPVNANGKHSRKLAISMAENLQAY